ncbi:MAG: transglycosylase SLT domain-containing protein [Candidatus Paceibacterota bacterium]|jgi:hypothetical protein
MVDIFLSYFLNIQFNKKIEFPPPKPIVEIVEVVPTIEVVKEEIRKQAKENDFDINTALAIADCESDFIYDAKNPGSSAKGVYQFTDGTWKWIKAAGHQYDYRENIRLFLKYFPIYPGWWKECL